MLHQMETQTDRLSRHMASHFERQYLYAVSVYLKGNKWKICICDLMYSAYYLQVYNVDRLVDYLATLFFRLFTLFRV